MPTSALGVAFYVFALFPGIAFIFAREGHQPAVKQTALRETAALVFVSAICDAIVAVLVAVASIWWGTLRTRLHELAIGDLRWAQENPIASIFIAVGTAALATLLGYFFGSNWADEHGLSRIWRSAIPRNTSAWTRLFNDAPEDALVQVALVLKSGAWVSGALYEFDNDPNPHPHRAIVLTQPRYRPDGSGEAVPIEGADYLVVEAGEIEQLHAAFVQIEILDGATEVL
ncbi:DUF6338 family protein [Rathayibacter tritici]|uniref:DUF6338 family protein n=1 Tax=Rathayibacter tritici TaxID=33888 RepID=UPI000CE85982|nr:DUF6338 family protein [Rathayibacter tritici]PPI47042.1 hypothetical protein C5D18_04660 [Rathayibacter tritici]